MNEESLFTLITSGGEMGVLGALVFMLYKRVTDIRTHVDKRLNNGIKDELMGIRLDLTEKHAEVKAEIAGIRGEMKNMQTRRHDATVD